MSSNTVDPEAWGSHFGIAGALLVAMAVPASKWGWLLYLASNLCWLLFAHRNHYRKLMRQTIVFTASSVLGILNACWPGNLVQTSLQALF